MILRASPPVQRPGSDVLLWLSAFGLALVVNGLILAFWVLVGPSWSRRLPQVVEPKPEETRMVTVYAMPQEPPAPEVVEDEPEPPAPQPPGRRPFVRTSEDQSAEPPVAARFQGERNTQATSDRAPDPTAPELPQQAGREPLREGELETTESDYQDGPLAAANDPAEMPVADPTPVAEVPIEQNSPPPTPLPSPAAAASSPPPPRPALAEGPLPVDVPVPPEPELVRETAEEDSPRAEVVESPPERAVVRPETAVESTPPARPQVDDPAFSGFQRKTVIRGSISRTGRSALDVADTPLGRYQAQISRAVEQEWQRNCVRHRDFITPGFLTVRFFVLPNGKVRNVQFVGEMETGTIQKGFTLNSIRNAAIPPMPPALQREFRGEPLELIYNFYF